MLGLVLMPFPQVIANAAIKEGYFTFADVPLDLVIKHFMINVTSTLHRRILNRSTLIGCSTLI